MKNVINSTFYSCTAALVDQHSCCLETKATVGGVPPFFTGVFEPLARVALYPTDEDGLGTWFAAA